MAWQGVNGGLVDNSLKHYQFTTENPGSNWATGVFKHLVADQHGFTESGRLMMATVRFRHLLLGVWLLHQAQEPRRLLHRAGIHSCREFV